MLLRVIEILIIPAIIFWLTHHDEEERGETYEQSEER